MKRTGMLFAGGIALILAFSLIAAYMFVSAFSYTIAFIAFVSAVYVSALLYRLLTEGNRRLLHFFTSLKEGDPSAVFPVEGRVGFERELAGEINAVAGYVRKQKKEAEEQAACYESVLKVMTHEIRNALVPVRSLSAALLAECKPGKNDGLREDLKIIHDQAGIINAFLDAYHQLAHLSEPVVEPVDVTPFFRKMQRLLRGEAGEGKLFFQPNAEMSLQADPNMLTLAMLHIIRNALQSVNGRPDGAVVVRAGGKPFQFIEVEDNGPGIPPDLLSSVFIPFFSTKNTGSGIGLSIAHRIVQLHGGELTVVSEPGKTVFTIRLC